MRVLIADDNADAANAMAQLLRLSLPCEVFVAYDGINAITMAETLRPDALILDLQMPGAGGLEVARRVRSFDGPDRPYVVALTGRPIAANDLAALDGQFDRCFAKPLDSDQLIALLTQWAAGKRTARAPEAFDLAELFTRAARRVAALAAKKRLPFSFDYRGPCIIVEGDPIEMSCSMHRLLLGVVDAVSAGFVMFSAETTPGDSGAHTVVVEAAGTGVTEPGDVLNRVLERLALQPSGVQTAGAGAGAGAGVDRIVNAQGICPNTGAPVSFYSDPREGVLMRLVLSCAADLRDGPWQAAEVPGARAWVVDPSQAPSAGISRRLQRLGWRVTALDSCEEALARAADPAARAESLSLLVVVESPGVSAPVLQALRQQLSPAALHVLAVMAGSPWLERLTDLDGYDVRIYPFSPMELAEFGASAAPSAAAPTGETMPAPLTFGDRPQVLLVDDNEINRIVGRGLLEALGYEVRTAHDGLDAIDQCRIAPPHIVLMDLDMPVLNGLEATTRLRELQRRGEVAPFAIVAATADGSLDARQACERAGMDGYLAKPFAVKPLQAQLRRFAWADH